MVTRGVVLFIGGFRRRFVFNSEKQTPVQQQLFRTRNEIRNLLAILEHLDELARKVGGLSALGHV